MYLFLPIQLKLRKRSYGNFNLHYFKKIRDVWEQKSAITRRFSIFEIKYFCFKTEIEALEVHLSVYNWEIIVES